MSSDVFLTFSRFARMSSLLLSPYGSHRCRHERAHNEQAEAENCVTLNERFSEEIGLI